MQAIIDDRGRQYIVHDGDKLLVDFMDGAEPGSEVVFDRVLSVGDAFGKPTVDGAAVKATVVDHVRAKKIYVEKFKRRKDYRRRNGHRQTYTQVQITGITT
ncbi:MAG: 50S ribosomal protein L21 [Planctomycetes bacterium]|nr:50S ribosomal protein L21 [Planctomycetota bacterium]